jgi:hypothetical protein
MTLFCFLVPKLCCFELSICYVYIGLVDFVAFLCKGPFGFAISKSAILNNDFKMCDLKKMIFKNAVKRLAKLQFTL